MPLYAATIFLSAFLLFLVQPVIARQILPWFGGSAVVWATCLVFFQSVLLAGYAYADFVIRKLTARRQLLVHCILLGVSLLWLPIAPGAQWKPTGEEQPALQILGLLVATIGLPYMVLSTTSPLIQAWYWRRYESSVPYRLFALSNFASLLALLAYPVAIEPWIPTRGQTWGWSGLYVLFVAVCGVTGWVSTRGQEAAAPEPAAAEPEPAAAEPAALPLEEEAARPGPKKMLEWLGLSATASCLLLAATNHITQNIAAVPFLWVAPLALYLVTFILAFDHPRWYWRPLFWTLLAAALPAMAYFVDSHGLVLVGLYTGGMFVGCMFLHGELAEAKPAPAYLTTFYLMMSLGGALGSVLIGILAPMVLPGYYELGILLVVVGVMALIQLWRRHWAVRAVAIAVIVATAVLTGQAFSRYAGDTRVMERNFYGVLRTRDFDEPSPFRVMYHGGINHGGQHLEPENARRPSSYFGPTSGYGRLFTALEALDPKPRKIGVIGLGAGALAVYAGEGDEIVFYELDPQVVEVAREEFSFMDDVPGELEVVVGDGRLSLEREQPRGYDVLAIDAFSGDSIPMHLVTREAMAIYVEHLAPDGAIVFQATNRYIDLAPVIAALAAEQDMQAVMVSDFTGSDEGIDYWLSSTDQIIVTRNQAILDAPQLRVAEALVADPDFPIFTDDYTNLLRILK
ncbi:fused MFS/spermidine synthase [Pseudenhygromyxa sp. WMMC2535]|uniref:fused MFS/spermidine synthase n=1 Tax=Pseudenhygromyxa sp. WMMC2535 TaxID=2712867 RepID=UPI0015532AC7|nr:fused MFS/spermidine synthase [Pseudenhygromyxa sp. WMMC2535]NVB43036.1 fused MFS/spermidine synthase [Pseudenhygromyxa sp. WMMC2535]